MAEEAYRLRLWRAKKRTLSNLLGVYRIVMPVPEPVHFYCPKAKMFVRVGLDELTDKTKSELIEFKKDCAEDTIIQVQTYKKGTIKADLEEIK